MAVAETRWIVDCLRALARHDAPPVPDDVLEWNRVLETIATESLGPAARFACKTDLSGRMPPVGRERVRRYLLQATARHLGLTVALAPAPTPFQREPFALIPLN